jgi:hypothetical protein
VFRQWQQSPQKKSTSLKWTPHLHPHLLPVNHTAMILGKDMWQVVHRLPVPLKSPILHIPKTFQEYVNHLPLGEQDLFSQLEMLFRCYTILDLIDQYPVADASGSPDQLQRHLSSLIAVSDGSSMDTDMTFVWTLSLPNGQRTAACSCPAPGLRDLSFPGKAYRTLAIVHLLFHLFSFCEARHTWQTQL